MGESKEDEVRLFSVTPSNRTRDNGYKFEHRKFHMNVKKKKISECNEALEQTAQKDCEISFYGDIQNLPGRFPVQPSIWNLL